MKIIGVWEVEQNLECEGEEKNESQGAREGSGAIWYSWVPFGTGSCYKPVPKVQPGPHHASEFWPKTFRTGS